MSLFYFFNPAPTPLHLTQLTYPTHPHPTHPHPTHPTPIDPPQLTPPLQTEGATRTKWKGRVAGLLNRTTEHFFPDGIMIERACELQDRVQCNTDQHSFKGYMHRALATVAVLAPFTYTDVLKTLRSSTEGCVSSCLSDGTCGFRWNTGEYDNDVAAGPAGQQMSALAALSTLLIDQTRVLNGPLTNGTGGTSKGDPNAGQKFQGSSPPREITAGDRAGSGIVTAVVLASFLGGVVWMGMGWSE